MPPVSILNALQVRANRAIVLAQLRFVLQRVVASDPVQVIPKVLLVVIVKSLLLAFFSFFVTLALELGDERAVFELIRLDGARTIRHECGRRG